MLNRLTPIVKNIIIINVIVFIFWPLSNLLMGGMGAGDGILKDVDLFFKQFFFLWKTDLVVPNPYQGELFKPIQIITYFFTHGGIIHIAFNMLFLASLGPIVEMVMGPKRFLEFYLFCGVVGGILVTLFDPSPAPVVGASGALFGVLVAFALYFPREKLSFFFLPPFESKKLVIGIVAISGALVLADVLAPDSKMSVTGGISHFGHLAGAAAGYLYFQVRKFIPKK
jgi:membrane associated rhomboid family serine protease